MGSITSAGVGSGLPLEDLIKASLDAKKAQFEKQVVTREANLKTSLSGVGKLKSAIDTFNTALQKLAKPTDFAGRKVTISQDTTNPVLNMTATDTASQGKYDIQVDQLAKGTKLTSQAGTFSSPKDVIATADGKLTFTDGDKSFEVDVKAGDTLEQLRKRINAKSDSNFGVSANIITSNGQSQLVLESSVTGSSGNLQITASTPELQKFDTSSPSSSFDRENGVDAKVTIDGVEVTNSSNTFDNVIQDLKFTVLRVSDKESDGVTAKKTKVTVEDNIDKAKENINNFVKAYNDLQTTMDDLGKRPVIVGGNRTGDPGELAGDPTLFAIRNTLFKELSSETGSGAIKSLFDIGIKMDKDGKLSVDSTKLDDKLKSDFNGVSALFSGSDGLAKRIDPQMKEYTKSAGLLAQRQDGINTQLKDIAQKRTDFNSYMVTYEEGLRKKYASLDVMIAKMNSSSNALAGMLM
ncbi:flagellar filament capping protein FliD [Aeromonas enteropelogenes]|uniref:flagellar filament capping protein FliD n=1 Tax=Aeromonas enteropelogenes TaxID=29489 RepID=UPI003988ABB6